MEDNMGRLSQTSIDKIHERRRRLNNEMDDIVVEGLTKLGGSFQGRIMDLSKVLAQFLREAQIKAAIKRLSESGVITIEGTTNSRIYRVLQ
jgi:hypothetical protein